MRSYNWLIITAEAVGQDGLQLFVDAGVQLDEALVKGLIKEVLLEKTSSMLSEQQPTDPAKPAAVPVAKPRPVSPVKNVALKQQESEVYINYRKSDLWNPKLKWSK